VREVSPAPVHRGLCLWPWNGVRPTRLSERNTVQAFSSWGAGLAGGEDAGCGGRQSSRATAAWPAGNRRLLAGLEIQDSGQGQEEDVNSAQSMRRGIMATSSAGQSNVWAHLQAQRAGVPSRLAKALPQDPPCRELVRHFSELEIMFLFLS